MGEPITPSPSDRASTRALCEAIVESVREDKRMPLPIDDESYGPHSVYFASDVRDLMMQLAQEVCALRQERDACWSRLENWDWRGLLRDAERNDYESVVFALRDVVAMDETRKGTP